MHRIRFKIAFSIDIAIYSSWKSRQTILFLVASSTKSVQYTVACLWITEPIKQPQHGAHGNSGPQRTQLLLLVCRDRERGREKETERPNPQKRIVRADGVVRRIVKLRIVKPRSIAIYPPNNSKTFISENDRWGRKENTKGHKRDEKSQNSW